MRTGKLNFNFRFGDYAIVATPWRLVRLSDDEPNQTIDFRKYYTDPVSGKELCYSIGYFWFDESENNWELKFVGGRFTEVENKDIVPVWNALKQAYSCLEAMQGIMDV